MCALFPTVKTITSYRNSFGGTISASVISHYQSPKTSPLLPPSVQLDGKQHISHQDRVALVTLT
jgi:hypothetical protein